MGTAVNQFFWGALSVCCLIAGLFFLRFWKETHDRLFFFFCLAFWALALHYLGRVYWPDEAAPVPPRG